MNMNTISQGASVQSVRRGLNSKGEYVYLPYDPKAPVTEKGYRTAKVMYKVAKTGENAGVKKGNNVCMLLDIIPDEDITAHMEKLLPHIKGMLEGEQDRLIKSLHTGDDVTIPASDLTVSALLNVMEAERLSGGRMTSVIIGDWFDEVMSEVLMVLFADKLGITGDPTQAQVDKIQAFLDVYKAKYCGLASNLVTYAVEEVDKLLAAMDKVLDEDERKKDSIAYRLHEKLVKMKTPVDMTALLDL